jgi:hypothetical protein
VELSHPGSNHRFDMVVTFTTNYYFSGRRRPRRQRCALGDRLRESKIKPTQFFRDAHKDTLCVRVFIRVSAHTCMRICVCTVFLKKHGLMELTREAGRHDDKLNPCKLGRRIQHLGISLAQ